MTITHHASDETLAAFASGTLDEARSVVVAAHLGLCGQCRATVGALEQIGGVLIERAAPAALRAEAIETALSRIAAPVRPISPMAGIKADPDCPEVLAPYSVEFVAMDRPRPLLAKGPRAIQR